MNKLISGSVKFIKQNGSTILTCIGGVGVVATVATAVKATPKALELIEEAKEQKGEGLTNFEVIRTVSPVYIPTVLMGVSTIACIFGANMLNKRKQASLLSAYALLNNSYKEYRNKVTDMFGEELAEEIEEEIMKDNLGETTTTEVAHLFYDAFSDRYFEATLYQVQAAEYQLNRHLISHDYVLVNDWYEFLGLESIEEHEKLGWSTFMNFDNYWESWIDFTHKQCKTEDGRAYTMITLGCDPYPNFDEGY